MLCARLCGVPRPKGAILGDVLYGNIDKFAVRGRRRNRQAVFLEAFNMEFDCLMD